MPSGTKSTSIRTVQGGFVEVFVYGDGLMRVCDADAPIPRSGVLSACRDRQ